MCWHLNHRDLGLGRYSTTTHDLKYQWGFAVLLCWFRKRVAHIAKSAVPVRFQAMLSNDFDYVVWNQVGVCFSKLRMNLLCSFFDKKGPNGWGHPALQTATTFAVGDVCMQVHRFRPFDNPFSDIILVRSCTRQLKSKRRFDSPHILA